MATQEELEARASEILRPLVEARTAQSLKVSRAVICRARFTLGAALSIAAIYAGFIVLRFAQGRALDALNVLVVCLVTLGAANAYKKYRATRSAFHSSEQSTAT